MSVDTLSLHLLTHSLPTRSASDLGEPCFPGDPPLHARILFHGHPWRRGKGECLTQAILEKCDERCADADGRDARPRSEEHTSELQSLMRISYAVFCLKTKKTRHQQARRINIFKGRYIV